jgi:hypothetical protein
MWGVIVSAPDISFESKVFTIYINIFIELDVDNFSVIIKIGFYGIVYFFLITNSLGVRLKKK